MPRYMTHSQFTAEYLSKGDTITIQDDYSGTPLQLEKKVVLAKMQQLYKQRSLYGATTVGIYSEAKRICTANLVRSLREAGKLPNPADRRRRQSTVQVINFR